MKRSPMERLAGPLFRPLTAAESSACSAGLPAAHNGATFLLTHNPAADQIRD